MARNKRGSYEVTYLSFCYSYNTKFKQNRM